MSAPFPVQAGNVTIQNPIGFLTPFGPREINEIPLDVVVEERIDHTVRITQHPIEVPTEGGIRRGQIADHAYLEPVIYSMRGAVSDFPISWRLFRTDRFTNYATSHSETRSRSAYDILLQHFREMVPFTLVTPFGDLENMLFRRFTVPRNQQTKHAIVFTAEMVELQVVVPTRVTSLTAEGDVSGEQAETQAVSEVNRGPVATTPVE